MKSYYKFVTSVLLVLTVISTAVYPRRANAILGLVPPVAPVAVAVGVVMTASGIAVLSNVRCVWVHVWQTNMYVRRCSSSWFAGALLLTVGVLLLDEPTGDRVEYSAITPADAARFGLTDEQREAYLHDLPEINVIRETIQSEMNERATHGQLVTMKEIHSAWMGYKDAISPMAFVVLEKVSMELAKQLQI